MTYAFDYSRDFGMILESDYPYLGRDKTCQFDKSKVVITNKGRESVIPNDSNALKTAIAQGGPVSVGIEGDTLVFQFYLEGILSTELCGTDLDHGVLVVGYGADSHGTPFYIVKNSWGADWGEDGYIRIAIIEGEGICGI